MRIRDMVACGTQPARHGTRSRHGRRIDLLELAVEVPLANSQDARGLLAMAFALLQNAADVASLDFLERDQAPVLIGGAEGRLETHAERQVLGLDRARVAQDERPLDDVLELAHVPGPQVAA